MLFNSMSYLCFFPLIVLIYFIIPKKVRYLWLLAASYYFYMSWNAKYGLLLFAVTFISYIDGIIIEKDRKFKGGGGNI